LVNVRPNRANGADIQGLIGDRLGSVVDHEDKAEGQQQQPDKTKDKTDHDVAALSAATEVRRPAIEYLHHFPRSMIPDLPRDRREPGGNHVRSAVAHRHALSDWHSIR
jgi:hypothetical protein